ncbi:hypothetical protein O1611_g5521 [Lasiodiplodia mahajangana]|uniref:Uncharacterized protein n=1 Tax=Lasiodiplodia mahajangana TaxID=1108764 RepID=A0ACC2JKX7_9PEZI|nr:hypothetical protein O1611_g5521 [Lasiodiplodia mahajangana]
MASLLDVPNTSLASHYRAIADRSEPLDILFADPNITTNAVLNMRSMDKFQEDLVKSIRQLLKDELQPIKEDLKSIREDLTTKIDTFNKDLTAKIDAFNKDLTAKIDTFNKDLTAKIDAVKEDLKSIREDLKSTREDLTTKIDAVKEKSLLRKISQQRLILWRNPLRLILLPMALIVLYAQMNMSNNKIAPLHSVHTGDLIIDFPKT